MRKIRIIEHISLDGVIQGPGGRRKTTTATAVGVAPQGPRRRRGHRRGARRRFRSAAGSPNLPYLERRFWPTAPKSPMADAINVATKYIATHRPDSLEWGRPEGLGPDIVAGVRRVKAMGGPHLIVWGSSTLTPVLLEHELADEILLLVFPVLLGTGKRFFSDGTPPREFALVSTKAVSSSVIISTDK